MVLSEISGLHVPGVTGDRTFEDLQPPVSGCTLLTLALTCLRWTEKRGAGDRVPGEGRTIGSHREVTEGLI